MRTRWSLLIAPALVVPAFVAACGGGSGSEEGFVRDLCEASSELQSGLDQALKNASTQTDATKAVEALVPPLEAFVEAFKDADPPEDLEDWHEAAGEQISEAVAKFKQAKTLAALEGFADSPVPDPPAASKAQLRAAAAEVEECNGVTFLKPD